MPETTSPGTTGSGYGTTTQGLSPYAAPFVTDTLALGMAAGTEPLANTIYGGQLTAGASNIQNQVFNGIGGLSFPSNLGASFNNTGAPTIPQVTGTGLNTGYTPGSGSQSYFSGVTDPTDLSGRTQTGAGITSLSGTPGVGAGGTPSTTSTDAGNTMSMVSQYMNPYLSAVLNPQLQQLRNDSQSTFNAQLGKLTSQGAYGGGRQAVMQGGANRDLLGELNKTVGTGYASAYDKGRDQFNTEQNQGLALGKFMAEQGKEQRTIESEGTAADLKEFERQRDYYKNNAKYLRDLIGPGTLPIQETTNAPQQLSELANIIGTLGGVDKLTDLIGKMTKDDGSKYTLDDLMNTLGFNP
jgi:hypothetical protein